MDRTLKTLFAFIISALFLFPILSCKKGGGQDNIVEYSPAGLQIIYQRQEPYPVNRPWNDDDVSIFLTLNQEGKKKICLAVKDGLFVDSRLTYYPESHTYVGYIPYQIAYGRTHEVFVMDDGYYDGENDCSTYLCIGVSIETVPKIDIRNKESCPTELGGKIGFFKLIKQ